MSTLGTGCLHNCRQPSKFQRGEPYDECAAGGPPSKPTPEWIFVNNIIFYYDKNKILVVLWCFCFIFMIFLKILMISIDFLMKIAAAGALTSLKS